MKAARDSFALIFEHNLVVVVGHCAVSCLLSGDGTYAHVVAEMNEVSRGFLPTKL
jgi:hypothetical protein